VNLWDFLDRRIVARELRKSGVANPEEWLVTWLGGRSTKAGVDVSEDSALQTTAVYRSVSIIAGTLAGLPLHVYRKTDAGKERATDHPLYYLLHEEPNPEMDSFQWRQARFTHRLLWGNDYSYIDMDSRGEIKGLYLLTPDRMKVERDKETREIKYEVTVENGPSVPLMRDTVLHVPGLGFDGIVGKSVIGLHREAVGLAQVTEAHGAAFFGNGARPGVVLESPVAGSPKAAQAIKKQWGDDHGGPGKFGSIAVLFEGMTMKPVSIPNEDSQFLETRQFQVAEIARMFGIPLWLLMSHEKDTSWGSGIEQQGIALVTYTLMQHIRADEAAMNRSLFSRSERDAGYFIGYDVKGMLRGDFKSRVEGYHFAISDGWMNRQEVRQLEDMNAGPDSLDEYLVQQGGTSLQPAGSPAPAQRAAFRPMYEATWERILRRARQDHDLVAKGKRTEDEWRAEVEGYAREQLEPVRLAWEAAGGRPLSSLEPINRISEDVSLAHLAASAAELSLGA